MNSTATLSNLFERQQRRIFVGSIVTPKSKTELAIITNGLLGVGSRGIIRFVEDLDPLVQQYEASTNAARAAQPHLAHEEDEEEGYHTPGPRGQKSVGLTLNTRKAVEEVLSRRGWKLTECEVTVMPYGEFLCPGFIDTHTHACQVPNIGLGQQYELLDWLNNVTFPRERRFADTQYAEKTYNSVVQRLIDSGTTTACYYATLHLDATKILAKVCTQRGQRAFVGKCQMDRNSPLDYVEKSPAKSVEDTKTFISYCRALHKQTLLGHRRPATGRPGSSNNSSASSSEVGSPPAEQHSALMALEDDEDEDPDSDEALMRGSIERLSRTMDEITGTKPKPSESAGPADSHAASSIPLGADQNLRSAVSTRVNPQQKATSLDDEGALVQPILTPRFAISCTDSLLTGISAMVSREPGLRIQTHLSESPGEIEFTKQLFPFAESYTKVYDHFSLLTERTVLAHAIHLDENEMELIHKRKCGISHCPTSNLNLRSGASRVGEMLNRGIKVGLGTDVSGGFGLGMLSAIREASVVAKVVQFNERDGKKPIEDAEVARANGEATTDDGPVVGKTIKSFDFRQGPLGIPTLFWLATMGGAEVASIEGRTGSLCVGKDFDALQIKMFHDCDYAPNAPASTAMTSGSSGAGAPYPYLGNPNVFVEEDESVEDLVEKFMFTADDRNITRVWVRGRLVGGAEHRKGSSRR